MKLLGDISYRGTAAGQAAVISVVAGLVTLLSLVHSSAPVIAILAAVAAHLLLAGTAWRLRPAPGERDAGPEGERCRIALGVAMLALLALSNWVSDAYASGIGPLYVLVFAWFGLHCRPQALLIAVPVTAVGYIGSLLLADARMRQVVAVLVLLPIATMVGLLIAQHVRTRQTLQDSLEVRERWRGALMATLAHDVRSPLTSVTGAIEILQDDDRVDERYRPLLDSAMRQSKRVLKLAIGILEIERVEHGRLVLDRTPVAVADLAREVAALTQPDSVEIEVDPDLLVEADAHRLEQVVYNLVNNALRHGRPPVVISAVRDGDTVEIAIEDHGDGVPERDIAHLFDRFSSADHSPSSVGLGLWIVQTLVDAHGGSVHYQSPRGGARFVVTLPPVHARELSRP